MSLLDPGTGGPTRTTGAPTRIQVAEVVTVNNDGTIDAKLLASRTVKTGVTVPPWWLPAAGERCLLADADGDVQRPICLGVCAPDDGTAPVPMLRAYTATYTQLPTEGLYEGMAILFVADAAKGKLWRLRYSPTLSASLPWLYEGGHALYDQVTASQGTPGPTHTTYADLATVGPQVTAPLAGDYAARLSMNAHNANANEACYMAAKIGAAAAADANAALTAGTDDDSAFASLELSIPSPATVVKCMYRSGAGGAQATFQRRCIELTPIRVG